MLKLALTFFLVGLIAAVLGFTGIAGAAASIAQFLFFLFVAIFIGFPIAFMPWSGVSNCRSRSTGAPPPGPPRWGARPRRGPAR